MEKRQQVGRAIQCAGSNACLYEGAPPCTWSLIRSLPSNVVVVDATPPVESRASRTVTSNFSGWRERDQAHDIPATPPPMTATRFFFGDLLDANSILGVDGESVGGS